MTHASTPLAKQLLRRLAAASGHGNSNGNAHDSGRSGLVPASVEVAPAHLGIDGAACASLAIAGYPREVGPGWLEPLLTHPGTVNVSVHIDPMPPQVAVDRLRKQMGRLETQRRAAAGGGHLDDPEVDAAAGDAHDLASRLARGESKLFRVGLYLTVHAADRASLDVECSRVRALASSMLLDPRPVTFRQLQGWATSLPLGVDTVRMRRAFDTQALAAAFPFTSPDVTAPLEHAPVVYGINPASSGLVAWDRWSQDNYNSVILARSGAGKSYLAKLEILRNLYHDVDVAVIDPEDEYTRLADAVGGTRIHLGDPQVRLNPFDLPAGASSTRDALTRRALFIHTLIQTLCGQKLEPAATAALDRAILAAYRARGITTDPRTWRRPAPLLADLAHELDSDGDPKAGELRARLAPFVDGSHSGLFSAATTTRPDGHLIVLSLRDLPDELRPAGILLALDAIWRRVADPDHRRRRLVVVDEAWLLMGAPAGASFLMRLAKAARKHWCGLVAVTQDAADILGSEHGRAIVSNAATQILLRQAPQAIDQIGDAFRLSDGERQHLLAAEAGHGLLVAGEQRVAMQVLASDAEHRLATTDPAELAQLAENASPADPDGDPDLEPL